MRLAWVSPLPPARSGIADYCAELLPLLSGQVEIELFAPDPAEPVPGLPLYPLDDLPRRARELDLLVYQLGNNPFHTGIYDLALRLPGVVELHDYVLHHLVARCTLMEGDLPGYLWHLAYERGAEGAAVGVRRSNGVFGDLEQFLDPLNRPLLDRSRGVVVHNRWAAEQIEERHPGLPIGLVPHHLAPAPPVDRQEVRRRLGLAPGDVMLASFGFITPYKRIESLLQAYAGLAGDHPEVRCFLVGEPEKELDLPGQIARLGLQDRVAVTGYVSLEEFHRYIAACDIAVNLRYPSAGETSGPVVRLMGSGKAVLVSNLGPFAEWPDGTCLKVDLGPAEAPMLEFYIRRLAEDEPLRRQLGDNARRYVAEEHAMERSVERYVRFLRGVGEG